MRQQLTPVAGVPGAEQALSPAQARDLALPGHGGSAAAELDDGFSFMDLLRIVRRRKGTILLVLSIIILATLVGSLMATPIFRATATIQIDRQAAQVVDFNDITPSEGWWTQDFYQTQYDLLKSRNLAERVVDNLNLSPEQQLTAKPVGPSLMERAMQALKGLIGAETVPAQTGAPSDTPQDIRDRAAGIVQKNLTVQPGRESRLVSLHFDSPDAAMAQRVVNGIADSFISMNLERRFDATTSAKGFLEGQLSEIKAKLEDSERELVGFARARQIITVDDNQTVNEQKLQEMNAALVETEKERIDAETHYLAMRDVGGASINILENPVIQQLKENKAKLLADYQDKLRIYKPGYPAMKQLTSQIEETNRQIEQEASAIKRSVEARFRAAVAKERLIRAKLTALKEDVLALKDRSVEYNTLKRAVDTNRQLYDGLLQRVKEIGVAAGVGTNNISMVDSAQKPKLPFEPNIMRNLMLAGFFGLIVAIALALLIDRFDDRVVSPDELERRFGLSVLGVIPEVAEERGMALAMQTHSAPQSTLAEAYRSLRTALMFTTDSGAPKVISLTSTGPGEGKTTTAISLATAFGQSGSKVLLIDADLRNPSLHKALSADSSTGLTNLLTGTAKPSEVTKATSITGVFVIPSGPLPPNPVELLSSGKMVDLLKLASERVDYVIVDGPPILGLADALVLARMVEATCMVVESGSVREHPLGAALKRLYGVQANLIGTIMTKLSARDMSGSYGYEYNYSYSYGANDNVDLLADPKHNAAA